MTLFARLRSWRHDRLIDDQDVNIGLSEVIDLPDLIGEDPPNSIFFATKGESGADQKKMEVLALAPLINLPQQVMDNCEPEGNELR